MNFLRNVSPGGAIADLIQQWRQPNPHRWPALGLSVAATFAMMMVFLPKSERADPRPPKVTYISTFDDTRTDKEIIASNIENQKRKEKREAEEAAIEERRKDLYRALGRATFVDVDAMEKQIAADRAAEEAAKKKSAPPSAATSPAQTTATDQAAAQGE